MKTRLENDVIDHIDVVHAKNEIDLLWLIKLGTMFDENQTGQRREWLYRLGLGQNWN